MVWMILFISFMLWALTPFSMGIGLAVGASLYTLRTAFAIPSFLATPLAFAPLLFVIFHPRSSFSGLKKSLPDAMFTVYGIEMLMSLARSDINYESLFGLATGLASIFGFYAIGRLYGNARARNEMEWLSISSAMLLSLPVVGLCYVLSDNIYQTWDRLVFADAKPVGLSQVLNVWIVVCLSSLIVVSSGGRDIGRFSLPKKLIFAVALSELVWGSLILLQNGTRGCVVAILLTLGIVSSRLFVGTGTRATLTATLVLCFLLFAGYNFQNIMSYVSSDPTDRYYKLLAMIGEMFGVESPTTIYDTSTMQRAYFRAEAVKLFVSNPLFGCGFGCTPLLTGNYPHNIVLETAAEAGLFGVCMLAATFAPAAIAAVKALISSPRENNNFVEAMIFISLLVHFQFSFSISTGKILFFFVGYFNALSISRSRSKI